MVKGKKRRKREESDSSKSSRTVVLELSHLSELRKLRSLDKGRVDSDLVICSSSRQSFPHPATECTGELASWPAMVRAVLSN